MKKYILGWIALGFSAFATGREIVDLKPFSSSVITPIAPLSEWKKTTPTLSSKPKGDGSYRMLGEMSPTLARRLGNGFYLSRWGRYDLIDPKFVIKPGDLSHYKMPIVVPDMSIDPGMVR